MQSNYQDKMEMLFICSVKIYMHKIQCKALLLMGYLVSFPRRKGTRTATLIKHRHKDTSPPCEGLGLYPELSLQMLQATPSACLHPQNFHWEICVHRRSWDPAQISALPWHEIRSTRWEPVPASWLWFSKVRKDPYSPCWAACSDGWREGNISLHISFHSSEGSAPNAAWATQKVVGAGKAGYSAPPQHTQGQVCPCHPLCPGAPRTLEDVESCISVILNRKLIKAQGEKPRLGTRKTAKQVDTSDSNLCEFKSSTKIGLITWEQCISPVLQISSLVVHFFFFFHFQLKLIIHPSLKTLSPNHHGYCQVFPQGPSIFICQVC